MLTEQLFEYWQVDAAGLVKVVQRVLGECDVFVGGSLADDLGNMNSDIDLYCFLDEAAPQGAECCVIEYGQATVDLHVVDAAAAVAPDLRPLVLNPTPLARSEWPRVSSQAFHLLHALFRNRVLHVGKAGAAEQLRQNTGADLLHLYAALWTTGVAVSLAEDVATLTSDEERWSSLYCARLAVEAAVDAVLATHSMVNPNPKWRIPLAIRAGFVHETFPPMSILLEALFPDPDNAKQAIRDCMTAARQCLRLVADDAYLASFDIVEEAVNRFGVIAPNLSLWRGRDG